MHVNDIIKRLILCTLLAGALGACGTNDVAAPGTTVTPEGVGQACVDDAACPGDLTCFADLPGGLCSLACTDSNDCGADALCRSFGDSAICVTRCSAADPCRDGWICEEVAANDGNTYRVCAPGGGGGTLDVGVSDVGGGGVDTGADVGPTEPNYGDPCTQTAECAAANALPERCLSEAQGFPDGYCSAGCTDGIDDCGADAVCLPTFEGGLCMAGCDTDAACRDGYECCQLDGGPACLPVGLLSTCTEPGTGVEPDPNTPPAPGQVGSECGDSDECEQGIAPICLAEFGLPICSSDCDDRNDCGEGNRCLQSPQGNFCINVCESDAGCADFLVCCDFGEIAACVPDQFCF